ncbi:hypothetical protein [Clostridium sp. JNZ J1-5]|nr:hypothetical protein [Clostridium sp.]
MGSGMNILLLILGVIEIVFGIFMERFTRAKYENEKIKNLEGLIKWEKYTSILIGILILIFSILGFIGGYEKYGNIFITVILVLLIVTYGGKKRYKK